MFFRKENSRTANGLSLKLPSLKMIYMFLFFACIGRVTPKEHRTRYKRTNGDEQPPDFNLFVGSKLPKQGQRGVTRSKIPHEKRGVLLLGIRKVL